MEPMHVAILELDPKACQENHGARLTMLLLRAFTIFHPRCALLLRSFSCGLCAQRACLNSSRACGRDGVVPPLSGSSVQASIRQPLCLEPCALI
jgi:hypothetical protein